MRLLTLVLAWFSVNPIAFGNAVVLGPPHTATITTVSTLVVTKNAKRAYLLMQNQSGTIPVIVKPNTVQSASEGIVIPPGGNYEFPATNGPSNAFYIKTSSSTAAFTWVEGQ